jgi:DNA-binding NtrC family response regulator
MDELVFFFSQIPIVGVKMNLFSALKEKKTLLVDDNELVRDSLRIVFATNGCFMRTAETAEEGMQALEEARFDLIISDLRLPGKGGLDFLKTARDAQPDTLCVLITAYGDQKVAAEAAAMGINDFIEKPFSVGTLLQSLALLINAQG